MLWSERRCNFGNGSNNVYGVTVRAINGRYWMKGGGLKNMLRIEPDIVTL